jgi:hypothetical protein
MPTSEAITTVPLIFKTMISSIGFDIALLLLLLVNPFSSRSIISFAAAAAAASNDNGSLVNSNVFGGAQSTKEPHHHSSNNNCDIYLAPSTIPGAGMGMFAGDRNFSKGEFLADGDLIIPSYDMTWHVGHKNYEFLWDGKYYVDCEKENKIYKIYV